MNIRETTEDMCQDWQEPANDPKQFAETLDALMEAGWVVRHSIAGENLEILWSDKGAAAAAALVKWKSCMGGRGLRARHLVTLLQVCVAYTLPDLPEGPAH